MIGLIQRVAEASVVVAGQTVGQIGAGLLVLAAVEKDDTPAQAARLAERVCGYRVFGDSEGRMNLSVADAGGGILLVPQFTLAANTDKGTRASFSSAADPQSGQALFDRLVTGIRSLHPGEVATGVFGAHMRVSLVNDGPVTFWLRVPAPVAG